MNSFNDDKKFNIEDLGKALTPTTTSADVTDTKDPVLNRLRETNDMSEIKLMLRAINMKPDTYGPPKVPKVPQTETRAGEIGAVTGAAQSLSAQSAANNRPAGSAAPAPSTGTPAENLAGAITGVGPGPINLNLTPSKFDISTLGKIEPSFEGGPEFDPTAGLKAGLKEKAGFRLAQASEFLTDPKVRVIMGELGAALSPGGVGGRIGPVGASMGRREIAGNIRQKITEGTGTPTENLAEALAGPGGKFLTREQVNDLYTMAQTAEMAPLETRFKKAQIEKIEEETIGERAKRPFETDLLQKRADYYERMGTQPPAPEIQEWDGKVWQYDYETKNWTALGDKGEPVKYIPSHVESSISEKIKVHFYDKALEGLKIGMDEKTKGKVDLQLLLKEGTLDWQMIKLALSEEDTGLWDELSMLMRESAKRTGTVPEVSEILRVIQAEEGETFKPKVEW